MNIVKFIKQISTGSEFEVLYCKFYKDLVHYSDDGEAFILNGDWEFVEEESCPLSFLEAEEARNENAKKRAEVLREAWVLFPDLRHDTIIHEFKGLNLNNDGVVGVLYEKNKQAGIDVSFEEVEKFVNEYRLRTRERVQYTIEVYEKYKDPY